MILLFPKKPFLFKGTHQGDLPGEPADAAHKTGILYNVSETYYASAARHPLRPPLSFISGENMKAK